jgi:hypothetical protein
MELVTATIGILAVFVTWPSVRGSTLFGPWVWQLLFFVALSLCAATGRMDSIPWRYALACLSFCPAVSLLGAKRPQDQMWHMIVATFAVMMILPAMEVLVLQPGQSLELMDLRGWFLWALVFGCWINRWASRLLVPATLTASAQVLALGSFLPLWPTGFENWRIALILWCLAAILEAVATYLPRSPKNAWDALWLDYRDRFGLVWAARVRERVNLAAAKEQWNFRLNWSGFQAVEAAENGTSPSSLDDSVQRQKLLTIFANVLRRFLSAEELQQRASELLNSDEPLEV